MNTDNAKQRKALVKEYDAAVREWEAEERGKRARTATVALAVPRCAFSLSSLRGRYGDVPRPPSLNGFPPTAEGCRGLWTGTGRGSSRFPLRLLRRSTPGGRAAAPASAIGSQPAPWSQTPPPGPKLTRS
jgi:hypothetical protein